MALNVPQNNDSLDLYIKNEKQIPIKTIFTDSSKQSNLLNQLYPEGNTICENLDFMGLSGIKEVCGLKIAYLSGTDHDMYIQDEEYKTRQTHLEASSTYTGSIVTPSMLP